MPLWCIVPDYELAGIQASLPKDVCSESGPLKFEEELYFKTEALATAYLVKAQGDEEEGGYFENCAVLRLPLPSTLATVWSTCVHSEEGIWCGVYATEAEALSTACRVHKLAGDFCGCQNFNEVLVNAEGTFDCMQGWIVKEYAVLTALPPG
jgi:hypothetical protein